MRIGLVCPYALDLPGGVQQQCLGLAHRLRELGDDVRLVAPGDAGSNVAGHGWTSVGPVFRVPVNGSLAPIALDPRSFGDVRRMLRQVDVVHVHEPLVPVAGWAGLSVDVPVVTTFHADPSRFVRSVYRVARFGLRSILRRSYVTAVSATAASALERNDRRSLVDVIIPNGVDTASIMSASETRLPGQVVFVGRDEPRKGLDVLLEAWPMVVGRVPEAELVVVGATRPARSSSHHRVRFLGRVEEDEKLATLASSAVAVAPNLGGESFGIVLVEMMAAGCATLASDLPAFRDVAGGAAEFVPPGEPAVLAGSIVELLIDASRRSAMGERGRAQAERYSWERVTAEYRAAYRAAIERR